MDTSLSGDAHNMRRFNPASNLCQRSSLSSDDDNLVKEFIESKNDLKQKFENIRRNKFYQQEQLKEFYQPITRSLEKLTNEIQQKPLPQYIQIMPKTLSEPSQIIPQIQTKEDVIKIIGNIAQKYLSYYASKDTKTDKIFGIRVENGNDIFIGNQPIWIKDDNIIFSDGVEFKGTPGLWELITLEEPKNFDVEDEKNYAKILQITNSYKHNNDPTSNKVKSSTGYKYNNVVKPLLIKSKIVKFRTGGGFSMNNPLRNLVSTYMNIKNGNLDPEEIIGPLKEIRNVNLLASLNGDEYIYWNNLDELLQRLTVLYGEIECGNNNPALENEVVRILQEIKEIFSE